MQPQNIIFRGNSNPFSLKPTVARSIFLKNITIPSFKFHYHRLTNKNKLNLRQVKEYYTFPADTDLLKVNNRNIRTKVWNMFKVNNKDTKTTPMRHFGVFIVNLEHISHLCSTVSVVNFEQVNGGWVRRAGTSLFDWPVTMTWWKYGHLMLPGGVPGKKNLWY